MNCCIHGAIIGFLSYFTCVIFLNFLIVCKPTVPVLSFNDIESTINWNVSDTCYGYYWTACSNNDCDKGNISPEDMKEIMKYNGGM